MAHENHHVGSVVAEDVNSDPRLQKLAEWFLKNGGRLHDSVCLTRTASHGYQIRVVPTGSVPANSLVVACPKDLTISVMDMEWAKDPWPQTFMSHWSHRPDVLTRFFIMEQYLEIENSFWWPYIASLPQPGQADQMNTPMWYHESDSIWIKGTNLDSGRRSRSTAWRKEYGESISLLQQHDSKRCTKLIAYSWELYKWAATVLTSRCFPSSSLTTRIISDRDPRAPFKRMIFEKWTAGQDRSFPVLIPVFDLANHDPSTKVAWEWSHSDCRFITDQEFDKGTQVFNNYGFKGNEELMMGYGFSIPDNVADSYAVKVSVSRSIEIQKETCFTGFGATIGGEVSNNPKLSSDSRLRQQSDDGPPFPTLKTIYIRPDPQASLGLSVNVQMDLLIPLSTQVANWRELRDLQSTWESMRISSSTNHNKTMVACQVLIGLRLQLDKTTMYDGLLPAMPENIRQIHAAEYRRSQTNILQTVISSLKSFLISTISHNLRVVSLHMVLTISPSSFIAQFRAAIHHSLRTRNPHKLREGGFEELTFTIWVCTLWMCSHEDLQSPVDTTNLFPHRLKNWLKFLRKTYGSPPDWSRDTIRDENSQMPPFANDVESIEIVSSYLPVITSFALKSPESLYADPRWTVGFLQYGFMIVQEEGFHCPPLTGERGEETGFMLFLEDCDDET